MYVRTDQAIILVQVWAGLQEALTDGVGANSEDFVSDMLQHPSIDMRLAAVRIIEVRAQYAKSGFDWELLQGAVDYEIRRDTATAQRNFGSTIKELKEFW